jgi:hypothetical protein
LRASHLKEAVSCPSPNRSQDCLSALSSLCSLLASGLAPADVIPHLCGASLLASKKKDGGTRPIAIGEVLRRLVSKCLSFLVLPQVVKSLLPLQVGVGTRGGAEAVVHAVNLVANNSDIMPHSKWTLLLDFSNAFNSVD